MIRAKTWFRCPYCGSVFEAPYIESGANVFSMSMTCPNCGRKIPATERVSWLERLLFRRRKI